MSHVESRCSEIESRLAAGLGLDAGSRAHVLGCAECARVQSFVGRASRAGAALARTNVPLPVEVAALRASFAAAPSGSRLRRPLGWLALAGAVATSVLALMVLPADEPAPVPTPNTAPSLATSTPSAEPAPSAEGPLAHRSKATAPSAAEGAGVLRSTVSVTVESDAGDDFPAWLDEGVALQERALEMDLPPTFRWLSAIVADRSL